MGACRSEVSDQCEGQTFQENIEAGVNFHVLDGSPVGRIEEDRVPSGEKGGLNFRIAVEAGAPWEIDADALPSTRNAGGNR